MITDDCRKRSLSKARISPRNGENFLKMWRTKTLFLRANTSSKRAIKTFQKRGAYIFEGSTTNLLALSKEHVNIQAHQIMVPKY